ncbi:hypothetical protein N8958_01075 [Candidatus Pelagibacter sp.]|nr:hypothetical protein [Candidatus Pelagibacter sp.]
MDNLKPNPSSISAAVSPFKWHCGFNLVVQIRLGFIDLLETY